MVSQNSLIKYIYKNGRFDLPSHRREASFIEIMKWQLGGSKAKWPRHVPNKAYPAPPARVDDNRIAATWIGHATVLLQTQGLNILTDAGDIWVIDREHVDPDLVGKRVTAEGVQTGYDRLNVEWIGESHFSG